jgi:hypothetical protein
VADDITPHKLHIQKSPKRSSAALRAEARAQLDAAKTREKEIIAATTSASDWTDELIKAARFVVDVNGDPPSIDTLRTTVSTAEQQHALREEHVELMKRIEKLRGLMLHYQFRAGTISCNDLIFHVYGEGDTRKEALEKARAEH